MKFEDRLQNTLKTEVSTIDKGEFIDRLHATQHQLDLKRTRFQSSMVTAAFLLIFGWASYSQLNDSIFNTQFVEYYSYEDNYEYFSEIDSSDYDMYIADMALYLLDDDDVWAIIEFFEQEEYEYAFNEKEIKL
jgi:hypothetical protein